MEFETPHTFPCKHFHPIKLPRLKAREHILPSQLELDQLLCRNFSLFLSRLPFCRAITARNVASRFRQDAKG